MQSFMLQMPYLYSFLNDHIGSFTVLTQLPIQKLLKLQEVAILFLIAMQVKPKLNDFFFFAW